MKLSNLKDRTDIGTIIAFAGHNLPEGYLYCDGSTYNITDQLPLFLTIGNLYGGYLLDTPEDLPMFDTDTVTVISKSTSSIEVYIHRESGLLGLTNSHNFIASLNGIDATDTIIDNDYLSVGKIQLDNTNTDGALPGWEDYSWYATMPSSGIWTNSGLFSIRHPGGTGWRGQFNVPNLNSSRSTIAAHNSYGVSNGTVGSNNHRVDGLSVGASGSASLTPNGTINANHNVNTSPNANCNLSQITHTTAMMGKHQHMFLCPHVPTGHRMTQGANANRNNNKVSVRRNNANNQADQTHATGAVGSNTNNKHNHTVGLSTSGNINVTVSPGSWGGSLDGNLDASSTVIQVPIKNRDYSVKYLIKTLSTSSPIWEASTKLAIRQGLTLELLQNWFASSTGWDDRSGNNYDVVWENSVTWVNNVSDPDFFTFDGIDDRGYVKTLNYSDTDTISEMSVFAWIRTSYSGGTSGVWANNNWAILDYDRSEYFTFAINDAGEVQMNGGTTSVGNIVGASINFDLLSSATVNDGNWHYVGWTFSVGNQEVVFYIDGQVDSTRTADGTMLPLGSQTTITRYGIIGDGSEADTEGGAGNAVYFEGDIGEIHFYDGEALTPTQVLQNYNDRLVFFD